MQVIYKKDEVYLVHLDTPHWVGSVVIKSIGHGFVVTSRDTYAVAEFHLSVVAKVGVVRRIFGIPLGVIKDVSR
jgi:hypothetical protein